VFYQEDYSEEPQGVGGTLQGKNNCAGGIGVERNAQRTNGSKTNGSKLMVQTI